MNIFLTLLVIFVVSLACGADKDKDQVFGEYLKQFNVRIGRGASAERAKENVYKRWLQVKEQNKKFEEGKLTFKSELNKFSWEDAEKLAKYKLGDNLEQTPSNRSNLPPLRTKRAVLPDYFNWADKGVVRPVEDQGNCGSCYAFAAMGAIESSACIIHNQCVTLSKQEAMECTNGCDGGNSGLIYNYAKSKNGGCSSNYTYSAAVVNDCSTSTSRSRIAYTTPYDWIYLTGFSELTIRKYLQAIGPMYMSYEVYDNFYQYKSGIYNTQAGNFSGGHGVLLTGWGIENGVKYWILKNSWGADWGEQGYFRISRGINLCNIEGRGISVPFTIWTTA